MGKAKTALWAAARRGGRFGKILFRDKRIPRWLRWGFVAALPIPGPVDEIVLILVLAVLLIWRREIVSEAWRTSR